jgi:hypothetical protein
LSFFWGGFCLNFKFALSSFFFFAFVFKNGLCRCLTILFFLLYTFIYFSALFPSLYLLYLRYLPFGTFSSFYMGRRVWATTPTRANWLPSSRRSSLKTPQTKP